MKQKALYYLYLCLLYPLALMPMWLLYRLSDVMYLVLGKMLQYRHKVVVENLTTSFPDLGADQIKKIQHDFYRHLCDVIVETIKLLHISDRQLKKRVEVINYEAVNQTAAMGKSIILYLGHYGNWEWVPTISMFYTKDIKSLHIFKTLRDPAGDRLMHKLRSRFDSTGVPQLHAARILLGLKHEGKQFIVGCIADQRSNYETEQRLEFLNHLTPYISGSETLGDKVGACYMYLDISKPRRGHYTMRFVPMDASGIDKPHPYTHLFYQLLQENILRQPALWLWSHRRWLYK